MPNTISRFLSTDYNTMSAASLYSCVPTMPWQWKVIGALVLSGTIYLISRFVKNYFRNTPPPGNVPPPATTQQPVSNTPLPGALPSTLTTTIQQATRAPLQILLPVTAPQFTAAQSRGGGPTLIEAALPLAPGATDEVPLLKALDWQQSRAIQYQSIATCQPGISVSIGMHASLLMPGGNALYHKSIPKIPGCPLMKLCQTPTERIEIYFSDPNYALRLHAFLHRTIGLSCTWKEVDMPPEESGFDYYRGAVVFEDPISFLFFTRHLCSQSYEDMKDYISARRQEFSRGSLLDKIEKANLHYSIDDANVTRWTSNAQTVLVNPKTLFVPPRMYAPGISRIIGAASSLLIPGWTSLREASLHQGIVYVELNEKNGLSLFFPTITTEAGKVIKDGNRHAQETKEELQKIGLLFTPSDLSQKLLKNEFGTYGGVLYCNDPATIALYLIRVCSLRREEVLELIGINKLEQTPFGKSLQTACKKKLAGEENYAVKILMRDDQVIPLEKVSINFSKLSCHSIPDLPDEVKNLDVKNMLRQSFKDVKNSIAPYADGNSLEGLQGGIEQIIKVLNGSPHSGVPHGEEGKKFVQKMVFVLKHIFYLLPHAVEKEKTVNIKAVLLAQIAIGGMACAGGHVQAILSVYQSLKQFSPLQVHHAPQSQLALAHVDRVVTELYDRELQQLRSSIFQTLVAKYTKLYGGDPAHFKNKVLKAIGKIRGIPGAEMADYLDPYAACAPNLTEQQMLKDFDEQYSLEKILEHLTEKIRYGMEGVSMAPIIDFLLRHAPENTDSDDFLTGTISGKRLKQPFLVQILIIAGHLSY
ncbi:MAG TPA: hypothetical protein VFU89_02095 [Rhabdochlamydiaceae bacterium]|nr:hypothetical protein [Rhabdochlamydiaceae bacterium]